MDEQNTPSQSRPSGSPANPGDFLSMISSVESQLLALKSAHAEHDQTRQQLSTWEAKLKQQAEGLSRDQQAMEASLGKLDDREREIAARQTQLQSDAEAVTTARRELEKAMAELEKRRDSHDKAEEELAKKAMGLEAGLKERADALEARNAELTKKEQQLRQSDERQQRAQDEVNQRRAAADQIATKAAADLKESDRVRKDLEGRVKAVESSEQSVSQRERGISAKEDEMRRREVAVKAREDQLITRANVVNQQREHVVNQAADLATRERTMRDDLARGGDLQKRLAEAEERFKEAERQAAERTERVRLLEHELASSIELTEQLESKLLEAQDQAPRLEQQTVLTEELESKLSQAEQTAAELRSQLESMQSEADRSRMEMSDEIERLQRQLSETPEPESLDTSAWDEKVSLAQEEIEALRNDVAAARDEARQARADADARVASLQESLAEQSSDESLRAAQEQIRQRMQEIEHERDEALELASESERQADALKHKLAEMVDALNRAETQAQIPTDGFASSSIDRNTAELIQIRRRRLNAVRSALRAQAQKIRTVSDHVRERYEEAEQVLAMRDEIAQARTILQEVKRRAHAAHSQAAKGTAAKVVTLSLGGLVIMAGLSWMAATQFFPPLYAARATITASAPDRDLTADEKTEWQNYLTQRLTDPQMLEQAADRMARRGIMTLATPGQLKTRLKEDMDIQSASTDELVVELQGRGQSRTIRELDTYITAVVSEVEATKAQRLDAATTTLSERANIGTGPIDDERPLFAALIWAGGSVLAFLAGLLMWKRLTKVRDRHEQEHVIDEVLGKTASLMPTRRNAA